MTVRKTETQSQGKTCTKLHNELGSGRAGPKPSFSQGLPQSVTRGKKFNWLLPPHKTPQAAEMGILKAVERLIKVCTAALSEEVHTSTHIQNYFNVRQVGAAK